MDADATPPSTEQSPPALPGTIAGRPTPTAGQQAFARVVIAVSVLIVLGAAALIYYRWVTVVFPTSYIQFLAAPGEAPEGAKVTVRRRDGREVATVTLTAADRFESHVLVEAGEYAVTTLYEGAATEFSVIVPNRRGVSVPVTTRPADAEGRGRAP